MKMDEKTDRKLEVILIGLAIGIMFLSGCATWRPNTQKGWHKDEIAKHTRSINRLNPVIYDANQVLIPQRGDQLGDDMSWQGRMKARMDAMKGDK